MSADSDPFASPTAPKFVVHDDDCHSEHIVDDVHDVANGGGQPSSTPSSSRPGSGHRPRNLFFQHSRTHSQLTVDNGVYGGGVTPPESPRTLAHNHEYSLSTSTSTYSLPRVNSAHGGVAGSSGPPPPLPTGGANNFALSTPAGTPSAQNTQNPFSTPNASRPRLHTRESFASPPIRPLASYSNLSKRPMSTAPGSIAGGVSNITSSTGEPVMTSQQRANEKLSLLKQSTMLDPTVPLHKPWLEKKDPYARVAYIITYTVILLGFAAGAARCWLDWRGVMVLEGNLCPVMNEDFSQGDEGGRLFGDNGLFFREVDLSGFGNGEFEMTTASSNNSYVKDGRLYILPTLTSDWLGEEAVLGTGQPFILNATDCTYNITHGSSYTSSSPLAQSPSSGASSANPYAPSSSSSSSSGGNSSSTQVGGDVPFSEQSYLSACSAVSNSSIGKVINPVQSARISTRKTASIRYGRVEVRAKMPKGDWMWPAIWMLPVDNVYGDWPMSGEIDIVESRGNDMSYTAGGSNVVRGSLNWGPLIWLNSVWRTTGFWSTRRSSYADGFHTYGLEWTQDWIRIYVDTRLHKMFDMRMIGSSGKDGFWTLGDFPQVVTGNSGQQVVLENPWVNATRSAPFDIPFYLIIDVGIGGTNGWFPDSTGDKPWLDQSGTAMQDFIKNKNKWFPTWPQDPEDRAMIIDSIKMWQLC